MKLTIDRKVQLFTAVGLILCGCILMMLSFFTEPKGEIHNSVTWVFAQILTFAGAIFGIDYTYKYRHAKIENKNTPE